MVPLLNSYPLLNCSSHTTHLFRASPAVLLPQSFVCSSSTWRAIPEAWSATSRVRGTWSSHAIEPHLPPILCVLLLLSCLGGEGSLSLPRDNRYRTLFPLRFDNVYTFLHNTNSKIASLLVLPIQAFCYHTFWVIIGWHSLPLFCCFCFSPSHGRLLMSLASHSLSIHLPLWPARSPSQPGHHGT